jgi:dTDP-4-amino-4,6-dideoxygalactose transaminase
MLDIDELPRADSFDGLIVTNTFGQARNLQKYYQYAAENNKVLCVDSALALGSTQHGPNECISFHHTKPWGFGEGGCAIIEKKHEELFRALISFGHGSSKDKINRRATNGKMSDIAAAFCISRLREMKGLKPRYQAQYKRISKIGLDLGFEILGNTTEHPSTPSNVPFLAPFELPDVRHTLLPTGKYYFPLSKTHTASDVYNRIVNVPCHIGMEKLSDKTITRALEDIATLNMAMMTPGHSPL